MLNIYSIRKFYNYKTKCVHSLNNIKRYMSSIIATKSRNSLTKRGMTFLGPLKAGKCHVVD